MWNLVWDLKAIRENSVLFSLSKIWLLDAPKRREKFIPKRHMKKEIQKPGFEFNTGLALVDLQTTERWIRNLIIFCKLKVWSQMRTKTNFTPKPKRKSQRLLNFSLFERPAYCETYFRKKSNSTAVLLGYTFGKQILTIQKKQN